MRRRKAPPEASPNTVALHDTTEPQRLDVDANASADTVRLAKGDPNLFVRPWVALWRRSEKSSVINLEWEEDHPSIAGRKIKASWKVTGDPELGLQTQGDRRLFNVLCEMTREQGLAQVVNFTRYDVLQRLGRSSGKRDYELLLHSFERLKAVKITARNVFRDARTGVIEDAVFSIIDDVTIVKSGPGGKIGADELPLSTFSWSDRIYGNIQNGFLLTFDLNIAQSLHSDVALVLYPLLLAKTYDGPGRRRSHFHSELRDFYENHLGMRSTPYVSKMEERLLPGHEELKQIGFLLDARIEPMKAPGQHKITYTLKSPEAAPEDPLAAVSEAPAAPAQAQVAPAATDEPSELQNREDQEYEVLLQRMVEIGVEGAMARQVLTQHEAAVVRAQLDCLPDRKPRDPAALFLYAVRRGLAPPPSYLERVARQRQREAERPCNARSQAEVDEARAAASRAQGNREEVRRLLGTATAFYEGLCDEARAQVRREVREELAQNGVAGRWQYPQPLWMEVLCGLMRDPAWKQRMEQVSGAPSEASQAVPSASKRSRSPRPSRKELLPPSLVEDPVATQMQGNLFARPDLYADTLRQMVRDGEVKAQEVDSIRERTFPLLDEEEWQAVKARALG